ncbi:MAG: hypothetical protein F6K11_14190 [Leptolyngbya sp. SIO3F4]|nr:hypothetical protein [Leptolyngbya sp. SIO3F4]
MSPFKRYSYLLTGAFLVVVLISLSFLGLQWRAVYTHEQAVIQNKFSENAINLDSIVKSVVDQLHLLQVNAEENLTLLAENPTTFPEMDQFSKDEEQRYQLLPQPAQSEATISNLQGMGSLINRSDGFIREINMTQRLVPTFRGIKENLQEVTWVYYLSAREFLNLYPYTSDAEYQQAMLELSLYTQALPENNPQRKTSWTEAYLDLVGQGMMVTAAAPVYEKEQFRGIVGMDVTLDRLNQAIQNFDYRQGKILIAEANQQLLAYPGLKTTNVSEIQTLESVLPTKLKEKIDVILESPGNQLSAIGPFLVAHKTIQNTPWDLIFFVPKSAVYYTVATNGLLASLIPLIGLGLCLWATSRLLNYGFIRPACQLVDHIEHEKKAVSTIIPATLPQLWLPWFEAISNAFRENRNLLETRETQLEKLKTTQLQLVQSEKMSALGNLVAGVAHEINNPLGFVGGNVAELKTSLKDITDYIHLFERTFPNPGENIIQAREELDIEFLLEDLPKMTASMTSGCDRIHNISQSLRLFARSDADKRLSANIHEGIDSTLLILKYRLKANDCRPQIQVLCDYGDLPEVMCYPGQLSQVYMNILANAIDMFDELAEGKTFDELQTTPQQINICTQFIQPQQIEIRISDNGKGIPKDICAKIFDRKFTTKTVGKGTGLGLAISHQVVTEKHNGRLEVFSKLGHGTEFLISLPVESSIEPTAERSNTEQALPQGNQPKNGQETVLTPIH